MAGRLAERVALITGASRGIGRACAMAFAREGAAVVVNYVSDHAAAESVVMSIGGGGGRAMAVQADVASEDGVRRMVAQAVQMYDRVDILVNNAGLARSASTLEMRFEDLDAMLEVNLKGVLHCVRAVAPGMMERGYGRIVNVASIAGLGTSLPGTTSYATTKAAVIALTKRLAFELGPNGISVNCVCPGVIRTDMSGASLDDAGYAAAGRRAALGRVGTPEEVAGAILFFGSDESSFVSGQVLSVDGGRMDFLSHSA